MSLKRHGKLFAPRVEHLEDRTVPAGNVLAGVVDGVLTVVGDDEANLIWIAGAGETSVVIRTFGGTTVNGQDSVYIGDIEDGYSINMAGGDDFLLVSGTRANGPLNVDTGDGNDVLGIDNAEQGTGTNLSTGAGDDLVIMNSSLLLRRISLDTGVGDDSVIFQNMYASDIALTNPGGSDYFDNRSAILANQTFFAFAAGTRPATAPKDTTAPTATLTTNAPNPTNLAIPYTVMFSEDVSNFTAAGLMVTNGTVSGFSQTNASTYTFNVTPAGQGTVSVTVAADAATDAAGNLSVASDTVSRTFDSIAPAAPTLNLATASDSGAVGDLRTEQSTVALTGTTEAGAKVTLTRTTVPGAPGAGAVVATTAAADGSFTFSNVTLALGPNSFVVRATDGAGNVGATFAQTFTRNAPPTVASTIADQNATVGTDVMLDISNTFADAERVVRFAVTYPSGQTGFIDINLFANAAPNTVANFVAYVTNADPTKNYDGSIFHRLDPNFVLQGGGFKFDNTTKTFTAITTSPAITNEPRTSNTLGTIAMAKGAGPNSATDEFFFNLGDNSANLDVQNGGFTVFGQVMNGGLQTLSAITSSVTTYPGPGLPGAKPFPVSATANTTSFPQNITTADLVNLTTATELTTAAQRLTFSAVSDNTTIATVSVTGTTLKITPVASGMATITVKATDLDGSITTTQFVVTVS